MTEETLLTTQAAGDYLHEQIPGESPGYWRQALINNRRGDRKPAHRIPFSTLGRAAVYRLEDLAAFCEFEKSRRLGTVTLSAKAAEALKAIGFGEEGATTSGRRWKGGSANVANNNGVFVQVVISEPLTVFRVEPADAIAFGRELIEAGEHAQRIAGEAPAHAIELETIADSPDALIRRRKPE